MAHDGSAFGAELMDERGDVVGEDRRAVGVDSPWLLASAVTAEVGCDDPETLRERGYLLPPGVRCLGEPMKQEDERALSFHHAVETDAVDPDVTLHAAMLARPMPLAQACLLISPSASGFSPDGSPLSSG